MSVNFHPFAALAPEDQRDPKLDCGGCLITNRCSRVLGADDITQIAGNAGSGDVQLVHITVREVRRQPVEQALNFGPAADRLRRAEYGDWIFVGPQHLSGSRIRVQKCKLSLALSWQDTCQELIHFTHVPYLIPANA